jgi:hypothetical protein
MRALNALSHRPPYWSLYRWPYTQYPRGRKPTVDFLINHPRIRSVIKGRVNGIALAPAEDFRRDSDLFLDCARTPESQARTKSAMNRGFQTRSAEMDLDRMLGELVEP